MIGVYLLQGTSGRYYLGSTDNLERRLRQHNAGWMHGSKRLGLPLHLVTFKATATLTEAGKLEAMLKKWKSNARVLAFLTEEN